MDDLISRESVKEILNSNALPYHVVPNVWDATYWDDEIIAWMPLPEPFKGVTA